MEVEKLRKRIKELENIESTQEVPTLPIVKDMVLQSQLKIKTSLKKLSKLMKTIEVQKSSLTSTAIISTQKSASDDSEGKKFDYEYAWIIRILCMFCLGITGGIMRIKLSQINLTISKSA